MINNIELDRVFLRTSPFISKDEKEIKEPELLTLKSNIFIFAQGGVGKSYYADKLAKRIGTPLYKKKDEIKFENNMIIDCWDEIGSEERKFILDEIYKKKVKNVLIFGRREGITPTESDSFQTFEMKIISEDDINRTQRIISYSKKVFGDFWKKEIEKYSDYKIIEKFVNLDEESDLSIFLSLLAVKTALLGQMRISWNHVKEEQRIFFLNNPAAKLFDVFSLANISGFPLRRVGSEFEFFDKTIQSFFIARFLLNNLNIRNLYLNSFSSSNEIAYFYEAFDLIHKDDKRTSLRILKFYEMPLIINESDIEKYLVEWSKIVDDNEFFEIVKLINMELLYKGDFKTTYHKIDAFSVSQIRSFIYSASPREPFRSSSLATICTYFSNIISSHSYEFRKLFKKILGLKNDNELKSWILSSSSPISTSSLFANKIDLDFFKILEQNGEYDGAAEHIFRNIEKTNNRHAKKIFQYLIMGAKLQAPSDFSDRERKNYLSKFNISFEWLIKFENSNAELHSKKWFIFWLNEKGNVREFANFLSGHVRKSKEVQNSWNQDACYWTGWNKNDVKKENLIEAESIDRWSEIKGEDRFFFSNLLIEKENKNTEINKLAELIQKIHDKKLEFNDFMMYDHPYHSKFSKEVLEILFDENYKKESEVIKIFVKENFWEFIKYFEVNPKRKINIAFFDGIFQLFHHFFGVEKIPFNNHILRTAIFTRRNENNGFLGYGDSRYGVFLNNWYIDYLDEYLNPSTIVDFVLWMDETGWKDFRYFFELTNRSAQIIDACLKNKKTRPIIIKYVNDQLDDQHCFLQNLNIFIYEKGQIMDKFAEYIEKICRIDSDKNYAHIMYAIEIIDLLPKTTIESLKKYFEDIIFNGLLPAAQFKGGTVTKFIEFWSPTFNRDATRLPKAFMALDIVLNDSFAEKIAEMLEFKKGFALSVASVMLSMLRINDKKYGTNTISAFTKAASKHPRELRYIEMSIDGDTRDFGQLNFRFNDYYSYLNGEMDEMKFGEYINKSIEKMKNLISVAPSEIFNEKEMQLYIHENMIEYCLDNNLIWHREFSPFLKNDHVGWIDFSISHNNLYSVIELKKVTDSRFGTEKYNLQLKKYSTNYRKITSKSLVVFGNIAGQKKSKLSQIKEVAITHGFDTIFVEK